MSVKFQDHPSQDDLIKYFDYDNGVLYRKSGRRTDLYGVPAGCQKSKTYWVIRLNGSLYRRSRLVWIMHNGDIPEGLFIDHINRNKDDDRIENLRLCTNGQNQQNTIRKNKASKHGRGVFRIMVGSKYRYYAYANKDKKRHSIGGYSTAMEAAIQAEKLRENLHNEFKPQRS